MPKVFHIASHIPLYTKTLKSKFTEFHNSTPFHCWLHRDLTWEEEMALP